MGGSDRIGSDPRFYVLSLFEESEVQKNLWGQGTEGLFVSIFDFKNPTQRRDKRQQTQRSSGYTRSIVSNQLKAYLVHYNQCKWLIDRRVSYVYIYILQYISTEISISNQYEYSFCWNGGEYTFIFHWRLSEEYSGGTDNSNDQGCVSFGRDPLGRRYLLMTSRTNTNTNDWDSFVLSSIGLDVCNGSQKEETLSCHHSY